MRKARIFREATGLSRVRVSRLTDIEPSHLMRFEHGTGEMSLAKMRALATLYGCTLDDLVEEVPEVEREAAAAE